MHTRTSPGSGAPLLAQLLLEELALARAVQRPAAPARRAPAHLGALRAASKRRSTPLIGGACTVSSLSTGHRHVRQECADKWLLPESAVIDYPALLS